MCGANFVGLTLAHALRISLNTVRVELCKAGQFGAWNAVATLTITMLATPPRRMSIRDVGRDTILDSNDSGLTVYNEASNSEQPCKLQSADSGVNIASGHRTPSSIHGMVVGHHCEEEDPLDLGFTLG